MPRKKNDIRNVRRPAKAVLPQVCSIGISIWDPVYAERFHASRENEFIHVMEGEMAMRVGRQKVRALAGDTLLLQKGTVHRDEFLRESGFKVFHVMFAWGAYERMVPAGINAKLTAIPAGEKRAIRDMAMRMYDLFRADRPFALEMMNASLYSMLMYCLGAVRAGVAGVRAGLLAAEKRRAVIDRAKEYIRNNFSRPISLSDIAAHLKLSEYYVSHLFSASTGFTFPSFVTQIRMERASALIVDLKYTVAEVAYRVGYEDPDYFGKVFYKHFNCTPSDYRLRSLRARRRRDAGVQ